MRVTPEPTPTSRPPQAAGTPAALPEARAAATVEQPVGEPPRTLVVDDNDLVRDLVGRLLSREGHVVDAAASVADALALPVGSYQAFIIDVRLGTGLGTDLIERLRAQDPSVPARCLLLTGGIDDDLPSDVAVLRKPFLADDLIAAVRELPPAGRSAPEQSDYPASQPAGVAVTTLTTADRPPSLA